MLSKEELGSPSICPPVGDPFWWPGDCYAINRFISRATNAENLAQLNTPGTCWGHPNPPGVNVPINCQPPYDLCNGWYCPQKYNQIIGSLVDMNIQFVARTAEFWNNEYDILPESWYNIAANQLVSDINNAYDCAGLRRPIIQAGIFEGASHHVNEIFIPDYILSDFFETSDFTETELAYYFDINGDPIVQTFDRNRMHVDRTNDGVYDHRDYDCTKKETQIWMFYQAKVFIDMGYKALHMGQYHQYAQDDVGYVELEKITSEIRNYAVITGSFVFLNGENDNRSSAKLGGTDHLIFDFDGRAMRPREISSPQVSGDFGCAQTISNVVLDDFKNSPCGNINYPAIIDPCVTNPPVNDAGGITPNGCYYEQVPYFVYFDFAFGASYEGVCPNGALSNIGVPSNGPNSQTWGYDDARWFGEQLDYECRSWWLNYFYCSGRDYFDGMGYLQIPSLLHIKKPENCEPDLPVADGRYLMSDNSNLVLDMVSTLAVNYPPVLKDEISYCNAWLSACDIVIGGGTKIKSNYGHTVLLTVENPDCSSLYSWHIQKQNGAWLPFSYGSEREVIIEEQGTYTFYLRQDNNALPSNLLGVYETSFVRTFGKTCCLWTPQLTNENEVLTVESNTTEVQRLKVYDSAQLGDKPYIFPNPVSKVLHVKLDIERIISLTVDIYNIHGQRMLSYSPIVGGNQVDLLKLDVSELASGEYFVRVGYDGSINEAKFIKL